MHFLYNIIITPIENFLKFCIGPLYAVTENYGISLILLSILVNILLIPLYHFADKWRTAEMNIQKKMSGEIKNLKKYYTGEKRYYQIKTVYRRYGYHPLYALRVSFGFLIQIPFFFAAYHFLSNYHNLDGASFLFINDLGTPDGFLFKLNILPVIMTLLNIASSVIYSKNMTNSEKLQLHGLSIIFLVLLYNMPSGLVLYWTMNNIFSLIKNTIRDIKTRTKPIFKASINEISLQKVIESFIMNPYMKYFVYGVLFVVADLMTFYYMCEDTSDGLARMSIYSSIILLFVVIAIITPVVLKYRTKNFHELFIFYITILFTNSIGAISLGKLLYVLRIISNVVLFVFLFQLFAIIILICNYFILQRDNHLVYIISPSPYFKNDTKNFIISLMLFNIIYFIWGPSLTVHTAPNEFFVSYIYILLWQLYFCLLVLAGFCSVYIVAPRLIKKYLSFVLQFFSITAIIYLIFNRRDVGLMSNFILSVPSNLKLKPHEMFLDILCIYSILLFSFLLLKYSSEFVYRYVFVVIIIILLTTIYYAGDILRIQNIQTKMDATSENRFELSLSRERENVLVFMLDGFSGGAMNHMHENVPDVLDDFNEFTWYKNVVTSNTGTWGAIPSLYGGNRYSVSQINSRVKKKALREYFIEAYNFYNREFIPKGYKVKIVNPEFLPCSDIDNNAECYKTSSHGSSELRKSVGIKINKRGYRIPLLVEGVTFFKASPHTFKNFIYDNGTWHGIIGNFVFGDKIAQWNLLLNMASSIRVVEEPTFNFITLNMPHGPNMMDSKCNFQPDSATYLDEAYCTLKAIGGIIQQMKQLGVYNNTMVVLISDHGWVTENKMFDNEFSDSVPAGLEKRLSPGFINPLLLVKDINSSGYFKTSNVLLSNSDLPSIVCSVIDSCDGIPTDVRFYKGKRTLTVDNYKPENEQEFLSEIGFKGDNSGYEVTDNVFSARNWKKVDNK